MTPVPSYTPSTDEPTAHSCRLWRQLHLALLDSAPTAPLVRAAAPGLVDLAPALRMGLRLSEGMRAEEQLVLLRGLGYSQKEALPALTLVALRSQRDTLCVSR